MKRYMRDSGPNVEIYLGLADSYAKARRIQEAIQTYTKAYRLGSVKPDQLHHLVDALVDIMAEKEGHQTRNKNKNGDEDDIFACGLCKAMWNDPITMNCGSHLL